MGKLRDTTLPSSWSMLAKETGANCSLRFTGRFYFYRRHKVSPLSEAIGLPAAPANGTMIPLHEFKEFCRNKAALNHLVNIRSDIEAK
jgi:hypothetical protein